jgi:ribonuclease HI
LVASSAWRTIVSSRWRRPEHINVLELRALTTAVRWVLSFRQALNCRLLVLCDSQVVVGAVTKGRSSSQLLLRRLRYLAAMALASGLRLTVRWVASADNPADGPSRNF